jgi:hypothetical protein
MAEKSKKRKRKEETEKIEKERGSQQGSRYHVENLHEHKGDHNGKAQKLKDWNREN